MTTATWDEIKRLAADFQRAQLSSTTQRLAERNCHELVSKLVSLGLIELLYTSDGKCYLTPDELKKEIYEEVEAQGGRANVVTVQQSLNVDMCHLESKVSEIINEEDKLQLILGQIIHESYLDQLAHDVNDKMQEKGQISFAELAKEYDLPGDFLKREIEQRMGVSVFGKLDLSNKDILCTESYVNRHRARIRGIFSALTRPTTISSIQSRHNIAEGMLIDLLSGLIRTGRLKGTLSNSRSIYTPDMYNKQRNEWINNFYQQNGYLAYTDLQRLGIIKPQEYIKEHFKDVLMLNACCLSDASLEDLKVAVGECLSKSEGYVDAMSHFPSAVTAVDAAHLVQISVTAKKNAVVVADTFITTQMFINSCVAPFEALMESKAAKDIQMNATVFAASADKKTQMGAGDDALSRKDERKKRASNTSKSGGGTQGREVKNKNVKNKYKGRGGAATADSDEETTSNKPGVIEFMSCDEICDVIEKLPQLLDAPDVFVMEVAEQLYRPLRDKYQEVARSVFLKSTSGSSGVSKRKQRSDLEEKVNGLYTNIKLFEKAINLINDDLDLQTSLTKHLLKTLCTDLTNLIILSLAEENMISIPETGLESAESRAKVISNFPEGLKEMTNAVHITLNGKSLEAFDSAFTQLMDPQFVGILLKKQDKKKDRQLIQSHRQALLEQLETEEDLPAAFHLAVVLLFGAVYQTMIHCSGRMVPQLVLQLKGHLTAEDHRTLSHCQDLIIAQVKEKTESDEALKASLDKVKIISKTVKKSCVTKSTE